MAVIGVDVGKDMLEAMGIKTPGVVGFELRVNVDEPVRISLLRNLQPEELTGLVGWLRKRFGYTTASETVYPIPVPETVEVDLVTGISVVGGNVDVTTQKLRLAGGKVIEEVAK